MYTAAALAAANPVLLKGEVVYESDTRKHKIGDGVTDWNSLLYGGSEGSTDSKPLGPFPGYRQISGAGEFFLGGIDKNLSIGFTSRLTAEELIGSHILFDAELHSGVSTMVSIPSVYAKIVNLSDAVHVVDFTTANPKLIGMDILLVNVQASLVFEKMGNIIIGCQLTTDYIKTVQQSGSSSMKIDPTLKWHGIYLEEVKDKNITI